jgi:Flp pilus assembly protein TadD
VGQQSTADRYTYLPAIGLGAVLLMASVSLLERLRVPRAAQIALGAALLVALGVATRTQVGTWRDSVTLARRAVAVTEGNYVMHFNLGLALDERGDLPGALASYAEAVRLRPDLAAFRVNHAAALARSGRARTAVAEYETAMRLDPRDAAARNNLAWLLATHPDAAYRDGARALTLSGTLARERPGDPDALDLLAAALAESGRFADAERTADAALTAAERSGRRDLAARIAARRALYAAGRAYREDPATSVPAPAN